MGYILKGVFALAFIVLLPLILKANNCESLFQYKSDERVYALFLKNSEQKKSDYNSYLPKEESLENGYRKLAQQYELVIPAQPEGLGQIVAPNGKTYIYPKLATSTEINFKKIAEKLKNDEALELYEIESHLNRVERILKSYLVALQKIRSEDDRVTRIEITKENFTEENIQRIKEISALSLYYTAAYMKLKGIEFDIEREILIRPSDAHFLNRQAKKMKAKSNFDIAFQPLQLLEYGAAGLYYQHLRRTYLRPEVLQKSSFFQYDVGLHEYTHHVNHMHARNGKEKPFNRAITIESTTPELAAVLRGYKRGFSVDEIRAFRASIKATIHEALTKDYPTLDMHMSSLKFYIDIEVAISQVTRDVFAKRILDSDFAFATDQQKTEFLSRIVRVSQNEVYKIDRVTPEETQSTYEMAAFTYKLFSLFQQKLLESAGTSASQKLDLLRRMNHVLTLPEVRRLDGSYPSMEKIEKIMED